MTDQTKHDIDHLHTKNKSRMHEIIKINLSTIWAQPNSEKIMRKGKKRKLL